MRRCLRVGQANTLEFIVISDRDVRRYFISARADDFSRNQTCKVTAHPRLAPFPLLSHEAGREGALAAIKLDPMVADPHGRRAPSRLAEQPQERLALAERLIGEVWIRPQASIDGEDTTLAHARALQARTSATVEATISSAVKWMRPAPAHSLQADQLEPAITSLDLADAVEHLCLAAQAYSDVVRKVAIDDATSPQLGPRGSQSANMVRLRLEEAMISLRATCRNALAGTTGTYASEADLAEAQSQRIQNNDRNINRTAMRRVDTVEAAERSLIDRAHAAGAELARLDAAHPYGKSAAPAATLGAHEAGFVSPAAA